MRGNARKVSGTRQTNTTSGVWCIDEYALNIKRIVPKAYHRANGSFRRYYEKDVKSLLHFDYPYPGDAGDGLRDEIGLCTWTRHGSPKWVGTETPNDAVMAGTPKWGYRCLQCAVATDYIEALNSGGLWSLNSSGTYEVEMQFRPTSLTTASTVWDLRDEGSVVRLALGHDASGKLKLTSAAGWSTLNLLEGTASLAANTWHHLVLRIDGGAVKVYLNGVEKLSGTLPPNVVLSVGAVRVGGCVGQIDEFRFRHEAGMGAPVMPDRPYAAQIDLRTLVGFGDGAQGDLSLSSGTTQINTYAAVTACDVAGQVLTIGAQSQGHHGALAVGSEVIVHISQMRAAGGPQGDLGRYAVRRITALGGGQVTLDRPVTAAQEFDLPGSLANYLVQVVSVPNYHDFTVDAAATVSPLAWDGAKGGLVALKTTGNCTVNGKIITASKGITRIDTLALLHADMADRFILTGNVWIVCGGTFTAPETARIGSAAGGAGKGGLSGTAAYGSTQASAGGVGCGGAGAPGGTGSSSLGPGPSGGRPGFPGNGTGNPPGLCGLYSPPNLTIVAAAMGASLNALSFGGGGGGGGGHGNGNPNPPGGVGGGSERPVTPFYASGGGSGGDGTAGACGNGGLKGGSGYGGGGGNQEASGTMSYAQGGGGSGTGFCLTCTQSLATGNSLAIEPIRYDQCTHLTY